MNGRGVARRLAVAGLALCGCLFRPAVIHAQCAMCSTAIGSNAGFARGFAVSIIFLLTTLAAVVGGFIALVLSQGRAPRRQPGAASASGRWDATGPGSASPTQHSASSS